MTTGHTLWLDPDSHGMDTCANSRALRIKEEAEKAKIASALRGNMTSTCRSLRRTPATGATCPEDAHARQSEQASRTSLFERTMKPVHACLKDAGISADKNRRTRAVGGMTHMPRVVETANKLINKAPHQA